MKRSEKVSLLILTIAIIAILIKDSGIYNLDHDIMLKGAIVAIFCLLLLQPDDKMLSAILLTIAIGIIWELIFENVAILMGLWYLPITIELTFFGFCLGFLFVGLIVIPEKLSFSRKKAIVWKIIVAGIGSILGSVGDYYFWDYEPSVSIIVTYLYWLFSWIVLIIAFEVIYHKRESDKINNKDNQV
jgi:hypothetical protein